MSDEERRACQECGKEPATVHLTEFIDGRPVKIDLGEECYGKKERLRIGTVDVVFRNVPAPRSAMRTEVRRICLRKHPGHGDDKSGEAGSGQRG